jgi:hypothetical protein
MFGKVYTSDQKEFMLYITIKCSGKKRFRVWAEEYGKKNSKYADREIFVEGERVIHFNFPHHPDQLFIGCLNADLPSAKDFEVTLMEAPLKTYNVWIDGQSERFAHFAQQFTAQCGYQAASDAGRPFRTPDREFTIKYFNTIREPRSGQPLNTPASIGHQSGTIYAAKSKLDLYTVAMRMIILLHEYSHKYKNPKIGLEISNEIGADINALYIYLGMGYSKVDAITVFSKVFLKTQTPDNMERIRKINDYIQRFENQEFAQLN